MRDAGATERPARAHRSLVFWAVLLGALLSDWATKWWALGGMGEGTGAQRVAFNSALFYGIQIPGAAPIVYTLLGVSVMAGVFWIASRTPARARRYTTAFGLVIGGGLGNVLEKAWRGSGTDFMSVGLGVFNWADVWMLSGGLLYLWFRIRDGVREEGWTLTSFGAKRRPISRIALPPSLSD